MSQEPQSVYGGQAVIEGVMFAGKHVNVTAVRRKNNEISYYEVPRTSAGWVQALKKIPLLRGVVALLESGAKGAQHLNFSADAFAEDEEAEEAKKAAEKAALSGLPAQPVVKKEQKGGWDLSMIFGVAVAGVISIVVGKVIFSAVPAAIEEWLFSGLFTNMFLHNLLEGAIKIVFLLAYLYFMSLTPIIKRLFQYHGAEHKVISAYEAGVKLTVDNVQSFSRLHYRCGSSFMIFTVLIGVIIYSFPIFTWDSIWERIILRIALLPVVMGVSYEVLRMTNAVREIPLLRYLGYPGLALQLLTTKEPKDDQVEISIASFNRMRELDQQMSK